MPRDKGIGRKKRRRAEPLVRIDVNMTDVPEHDAELEPEVEPEPERPEDWLCALVLCVASEAVDVQRARNYRFIKYAAMASACAEAARHSTDGRPEAAYKSAWCQANSELEWCCVTEPYSSVSPRYRCDSCGTVVCRCMCRIECACGAMVARWGWRHDLENVCRFRACACPNGPRARWDWARFDRRL